MGAGLDAWTSGSSSDREQGIRDQYGLGGGSGGSSDNITMGFGGGVGWVQIGITGSQWNFGSKKPTSLVKGDVDMAQQEQAPDNPGLRKVTFSTYGIPIPVSIGRRAITGNVIDASDIVPVMVGTTEYWVDYKIPLYETGGEPGGIG